MFDEVACIAVVAECSVVSAGAVVHAPVRYQI